MISNIILFRSRKLSVAYQRPFLINSTAERLSARNESVVCPGLSITNSLLEEVEDPYASSYGDLARKAIKLFIYEEQVHHEFLKQEQSSSSTTSSGRLCQLPGECSFKSDLLGSTVIGLQCLQTSTTHYAHEMLPHFPSRLFLSTEYSTIRRYALLVAGPINQITDAMIGSIFLQFCGDDIHLISVLMRLNRRYCRIFSSDQVWNQVKFPATVWNTGIGNNGDESALWDTLRRDHGIPVVTMNKLRWYSHNFSRLKNFYGNVTNFESTHENHELDLSISSPNMMELRTSEQQRASVVRYAFSSVMQMMFNKIKSTVVVNSGLRGANNNIISKLVILIGLPDQSLISTVTSLLHFIVPTTATRYHLDKHFKPLLPNGRILAREDSPCGSRTRNSGSVDPGTIFECSEDLNMFFRRIGDSRLTFIQFDTPPLCKNADMKVFLDSPSSRSHNAYKFDRISLEESLRSNWTRISERAIGFILAIEYDPSKEISMAQQFRSLLQHHVLYHCGSGYCREEPLLIYVGVRKSFVKENADNVFKAVCFVRNILTDVITLMHGIKPTLDSFTSSICTARSQDSEALSLDMNLIVNNSRQFPWYIQPIEMNDCEGDLKHGFFAGINWLTRTLSKQMDNKRF